MAEQVGRKLAAILVSDVVGYSRLAGADEELTLARLRALRSDLIDPIVAVHRGRVVKRTGDGALVEFRSVVDAVRCAIEVQTGLVERNAGLPPERRIEFRIGIHLGDVMEEADGDLMGDGVNIAARLETMCEPGGVCLSEDAYRQVRNRLDLAVTDLGDQALKNIAEPVRVYALTVGQPAVARAAAQETPKEPFTTPAKAGVHRSTGETATRVDTGFRRYGAIFIAVAVLIVIAAVAAWYFLAAPGNKVTVANAPAHLSIVVLPFTNLSGDPKQDYFADGITDNLTTDLSRIRNSFVIARNTAFTYKGKAVDAKAIGKELGVRYVLEGSVARDGNRVRVNAQLIDAESGSHLWADRFEEDLADLFKLQDDVVARLARALQIELVEAESQRIARNLPQNPDVIDLTMQGWALLNKPRSKENNQAAAPLFEKALKLNSSDLSALRGMGVVELRAATLGWSDNSGEAYTRAMTIVNRILTLDANDGSAYALKAELLFARMRPTDDAGAREVRSLSETALRLDPSLVEAYFPMSVADEVLGRYEQAILDIAQAIKLNPRDPANGIWHLHLGRLYFAVGKFDDAILEEQRALDAGFRNAFPYAVMAAIYAAQGNDEAAKTSMMEARRILPDLSVRWFHSHLSLFIEVPRGFRDAIIKAGLPEDVEAPAKHLSIVVLPFENLSGDPKQDYFADGITDNLTTDLSRIRNSFVIARNTAFTYKGKAVDAKEIGKELGVRYVLEGSVQRDGNRVRVNAQLIDAESGAHLWADRFEEDLADLFKLQDDVVARLANALGYELIKAEAAKGAHSTDPDAIDLTMQGWAQIWQPPTKHSTAAAHEFFERAMKLAPDNAEALVGLAYSDERAVIYAWTEQPEDATSEARDLLNRAGAISPAYAFAHYVEGIYFFGRRQFREAVEVQQLAARLNPNLASAYYGMGQAEIPQGLCKDAVAHIAQAFKLNPRDPGSGVWHLTLGNAEYCLGHDAESADQFKQAIAAGYQVWTAYVYLAAADASLGNLADAQDELAEAKRKVPDLSIEWIKSHGVSSPRQWDALRKIGLPENASPKHLSIVVLPFDNLSGDPKQDYFADGITDNLTTDLSRIRNSFVIARNTAFTYKGKAVDAKEIGKELGVRYVLEGSVARDGNRVRVNAQLIDAESGAHLWADRFEEDLADLFKLQDDVVARLANTLGSELVKAEAERASYSTNPDAIDLAMRGRALLLQPPAKDTNLAARRFFEAALKVDPDNDDALAGEARTYEREFVYGWTSATSRADFDSKILPLADRAIALNPGSMEAYLTKVYYLFLSDRAVEALAAANAGLAVNPNFAPLYIARRGAELTLGRFGEAVSDVQHAMELSPRDQEMPQWHFQLGAVQLALGKYDAVIAEENKSIESGYRAFQPYTYLAAAFALTDKMDEAKTNLAEAVRINPMLTLKWAETHSPNQTRYFEGLRKAGLREDEGPRLSIVVLPFQNLSGDAKQDYLADVLTDELTTYISRIPSSFVIARNTAFTYKGKPTDVKEIGKDLGVRYMLEGSVQPTDKRIRTNAQLIDTETGAHLWAEEFDTDKTDLLQTEDEIVTRLARTLDIQLTAIEVARAGRVRPDNPDAQDLALRCLANVNDRVDFDPQRNAVIYAPCERALQIDPRNVLAVSLLAYRHAIAVPVGYSADPAADLRMANDYAARALAIDPSNYFAHAANANLLFAQGRMDDAIVEAERAIALNPSGMSAYNTLCGAYNGAGRHDQALACADKTIRLSPRDPILAAFFFQKYWAFAALHREAEALEWLDRGMALAPNQPLFLLFRPAALARAGHDTEAREAYRRYMSFTGAKIKTIAQVRAFHAHVYPATDPMSVADRERSYDALRKAGMPEQ